MAGSWLFNLNADKIDAVDNNIHMAGWIQHGLAPAHVYVHLVKQNHT